MECERLEEEVRRLRKRQEGMGRELRGWLDEKNRAREEGEEAKWHVMDLVEQMAMEGRRLVEIEEQLEEES